MSRKVPKTPDSAVESLRKAAIAIEDRAAQRDAPEGERSMERTVNTFNALTGLALSEREGWIFMTVLKLTHAQTSANNSTLNPDDYIDGAAYLALALESLS